MLIANKKLQKHLALFPVERLDKDNKVRVMKGNCNFYDENTPPKLSQNFLLYVQEKFGFIRKLKIKIQI